MAKVRLLFVILILPAVFALPEIFEKRPAGREIAVTVDDLPGVKTGGDGAADAIRVSQRIVRALKKLRIPTLGFVNGQREFPDDPGATARILKIWTDAGMELGNHTARHSSLHQVSVEAFKADVRDGLTLLREKMDPKARPVRYFRHPCLHTGRSLEVRAGIDGLLREIGLTVAPVTFDNGEWIYAAAYHKANVAADRKTKRRIADSYLEYMQRKLAYFENQSLKLLDREMPQIMLIHANKLNADHLSDLLNMLKKRGYRFVSLDQVLKDDAFELPDTYVGRGGISCLHRWAWSRGVDPKTFFAGEPEVPADILDLAGIK
ncbi:MAG TPA: polysaccharide deacetylase family protein, partial [Candidatus Binatia bacterium]|nr:polysaccharide deacetylase family protein [Candidatus Binatia bacterium]